MSERSAGICAELISRRLVPRDDLPEMEDDLSLRDDVSRRLSDVGLILLDRPGIPYWGVAIAEAYRTTDTIFDQRLNSRALGLLLYLWLQLVAPFLYDEHCLPENYAEITVSMDALLAELPGGWAKTTLKQYIGRLARLNFVQKVRGTNLVCAGPMLWLAIDHDQLLQFLRTEKGLPKAIERFMKQKQDGEM